MNATSFIQDVQSSIPRPPHPGITSCTSFGINSEQVSSSFLLTISSLPYTEISTKRKKVPESVLFLLLVSIFLLFLSSSHSWAQGTDKGDPPLVDVAEPKVVEIETVLELFRGDQSTWPVQQKDRWCWAASAQIIMSSHGHTSWKQCIQADDLYPQKSSPRTCCDYPDSPLCNRTGWPHFENYGFNHSQTSVPLTWQQLKDEIDRQQPVAIAVRFIDPKDPDVQRGGHMGVVAGYRELPGGEQAILVIDPDGFRVAEWTLYDEVLGGSSDFSRHWKTYYDIYPYP